MEWNAGTINKRNKTYAKEAVHRRRQYWHEYVKHGTLKTITSKCLTHAVVRYIIVRSHCGQKFFIPYMFLLPFLFLRQLFFQLPILPKYFVPLFPPSPKILLSLLEVPPPAYILCIQLLFCWVFLDKIYLYFLIVFCVGCLIFI